MARERTTASLAALDEEGRARVMARFAVLRPHLEEGVPLTRAAGQAGVSPRTAQRWLARYHRDGLAGLARSVRGDAGAHRAPPELVALIEGLGLKRPRSSAAAFIVAFVMSPRRGAGAHPPTARFTRSSRAWTRRW
jgi:putative transposase